MTLIVSLLFTGLVNIMKYNPFLVYCPELAPGTVSLTGDRAQGDDCKHDLHYTSPCPKCEYDIDCLPSIYRFCKYELLFVQSVIMTLIVSLLFTGLVRVFLLKV